VQWASFQRILLQKEFLYDKVKLLEISLVLLTLIHLLA